ncbi:hypothetical protein Rxyl_1753 [Rubrobacter xylanophilus DSM 9941]|uniref:Phenylacetic acid degradation B n=1 Tax=Rubrobacter xylanophilus (strain DSM 9941 / JCM 11954 / NBRC 16129 / PRD-1) TaxID=266117 RepID=Q1AV66_RUBXD|nr:hypothetical protein [Rubrobacter xylanophilus]ABG04712.1 hypothetical protein Rxyl_1753 [Rubrobacter xylanophilus DSM 9941]
MPQYMVFARTEYDDPLQQRGTLEAPEAEEARRLALERFGGEWLELVLIPADEVEWAIREESGTEVEA